MENKREATKNWLTKTILKITQLDLRISSVSVQGLTMNNVSACLSHDDGSFFEQALQQCSWQHFVTATSGHYTSPSPRRRWVAQPRPFTQIWNTVPFIHQRPVIKPLVALIKGRHNVVLKGLGHRQLLLKSLSIFWSSFTCTHCVLVSFFPLSWSHISHLLQHTSTPWRLQIASCLASSPCVIATCWSGILHIRILIDSRCPQILFLNI